MEVSVVTQQQAAAVVRSEPLFPAGTRAAWGRVGTRLVFPRRSGRCGVRVPAAAAVEVIRAQMNADVDKKISNGRRRQQQQDVRSPQFFVGLPLDAISACNSLNHAKAIAAGLRALKLLGVDGVEMPVWWGVVEKESMGNYNWSGYLALAQMIRENGLQIHVSLCFHASKVPAIQLPSWLSSIGDADPDIYFTDKEGKRHKECLSLAVDELPVLGGKTPIQVYEDFCRSFQNAFSDFLGSTITDISIGLGPDGELRYPSLPSSRNKQAAGVGEFQCYGKHMLAQLKQYAEETGNHNWGLSGPHDAPRYDQSPDSGNFFKENGGSWESPYGDFFLSWYSSQLLSHGDRILSRVAEVFSSCPVNLSAKIPLMHSWYRTRSHPSELTAGYYNTERRDGYNAVAETLARNSCGMILTGMELSDKHQPQASCSSPEMLLSQIAIACKELGVRIFGENSSVNEATDGFAKIRENIMGGNSVESFTYQRMGAQFFSPEHWPRFTDFILNYNRIELHADDLLSDEGETVSLSTDTITGKSRQMQPA